MGAIVKLAKKMVKKTNFLLFSLIASLAVSPAYSVTVTKTYVDKQDKGLQTNILLLRDMLNTKDSSGKWLTLDTEAKLAIPAINELHAAQTLLQEAIESKQDAGDYVVVEDLKELQDAIAELEAGKVNPDTITSIQTAIDNLGQTYATKAELTSVETALLEKINAIDIPSLEEYVKKSELAPVATSGSYNDLTDVPADLVTSAQLAELRTALETEIAKKQDSGNFAEADALQNVVTELNTLTADVYTKAEIDKKIADVVSGGQIDLSGYATTSALDALSQLVSGNTAEINALKSAGYITESALEPYVKSADIEANYATKGEMNDLSDRIDVNAEDVAANELAISGVQGSVTTLSGQMDTVQQDLTDIKESVAENMSDIADNLEYITSNSEAIQEINTELDGLAPVAKSGSFNDLVDAPDMNQYVTNETIQQNYVTNETLESNYVTNETLENNYVTNETLESNYVTNTALEQKQFLTEEKAADTYLTEEQAAQTYLTEQNVNEFVEIKDGSITAVKLADGAVTAEKIDTGTGNAGEMVMLMSNGDGTSQFVSVSVVE